MRYVAFLVVWRLLVGDLRLEEVPHQPNGIESLRLGSEYFQQQLTAYPDTNFRLTRDALNELAEAVKGSQSERDSLWNTLRNDPNTAGIRFAQY